MQPISTDIIVWLTLAGIFASAAIMWGIYKLIAKLSRPRETESIDSPAKKVLIKSIASNKSADVRGIKSTGFEPTLKRSVESVKKDEKKQNFLDLLDELNGLEDNKEELERKRRKREKELVTTASSVGIEASASDETASQTFIGREPPRPDPGRIELDLIKADSTLIEE